VDTYQHQQLDALGDATRRAILARLVAGPQPVGELAKHFPVSRPAISQHLRILKDAQLVIDRAVGNRRLYEVNPAGCASLRTFFDDLWTKALDAFAKRAEETAPASEQQPSTEEIDDDDSGSHD
jgi:DNA-binding transcriptional ArsR family regulator